MRVEHNVPPRIYPCPRHGAPCAHTGRRHRSRVMTPFRKRYGVDPVLARASGPSAAVHVSRETSLLAGPLNRLNRCSEHERSMTGEVRVFHVKHRTPTSGQRLLSSNNRRGGSSKLPRYGGTGAAGEGRTGIPTRGTGHHPTFEATGRRSAVVQAQPNRIAQNR
jgi:hypothetical protein